MVLDPRRHAYRTDLADAALEGRVDADRFVTAQPMQITVPIADVFGTPECMGMTTQMLFGEKVMVFEIAEDMAWVQGADGYVGYVAADAIGAITDTSLTITSPVAQIYVAPDIKSRMVTMLPHLAQIVDLGETGDFHQTDIGFVHKRHINPSVGDMVSFAELYVGSPYLWGGRSYLGLDCSALIQLSAMACGIDCPRDSDMQRADFGTDLSVDEPLRRGDIIFWDGHVGILVDGETLLHANGYHMSTVVEPLAQAIARIEGQGGGAVTARKRL